jgi:hypothetical protein
MMIPRGLITSTTVLMLFAASSAAQPESQTPREIPLPLILYKYAPSAFTDEFMGRLSEQQMMTDQNAYKGVVDQRGQRKVSPDHVFVFSEEQVRGRVPSFARQELLPTYRKYWADLASKVPARLTFLLVANLMELEYSGGVLKAKRANEVLALSEGVSRGGIMRVPRFEKVEMPPLGEREVVKPAPALRGQLPVTHLADTLRSVARDDRVYTAFDRQIVVPALPMDAKTAERMWQQPDCSVSEIAQRGMTREQTKAAADQCTRERSQYAARLTAAVDIEIEGIDRTPRGSLIIKARVLEVKVLGPRQELIKTLVAADLPKGEDVWKENEAARKERQDLEARKKSDARKAAVLDQEATHRQGQMLKNADVIGIRLGMTMAEAEQIVRAHFQVAVVTVDDSKSKSRPEPFHDKKTFHNADNSEKIVLIKGSPDNETVVAVAREFDLGPDMKGDQNRDKVKDLLKQKYGPPDVDWKTVLHWSAKKPASCLLSVGAGGRGGKVVEGQWNRGIDSPYVPSLGFSTFINKDDLPKVVSDMQNCGPVVMANIGNSLTVALYDLTILAPLFVLPSAPAPVKPKL